MLDFNENNESLGPTKHCNPYHTYYQGRPKGFSLESIVEKFLMKLPLVLKSRVLKIHIL